MPGTPTRYGIPTLAGNDLISGIDDWGVDAMAAIDSKLAPSEQGALAARPVSTVPSPSGKAGRTYYATDTGQYFRDTGTGWTELVVAGATPPGVGVPAQQAWQTIALAGFLAANLSYYKDSLGNVHFKGDALTSASPGAGSTLCTLPAGYRPGVTIYQPLLITNATGSVTISIDTAGLVKNISALGASPWSFGACHFRAEN